MSDQRPYPGLSNSTPAQWIGVGLLAGFVGGIFLAAGDAWAAVLIGALLASVGGVLLTIGTVAKGVEVGIRNARD